ncbi:MAG: homoserine dehydrogenase [Oscillospiraceae bacterium]|jgi:homoserine dehydrogenase|nr:homoserine dehydrogenase [Oscillospiraceae bacterium]
MLDTAKVMRIGLLGMGTVGGGVYEFAQARKDMEIAYILDIRQFPELQCTVTSDIDVILRDPTVDAVIETMGGLHPAYEYVCAALRAGKHVITANKLLIAAHYRDLVQLASENHVALRCSAAVGGGIPWLPNLECALEQENIIRISGIMNGTTNYILDSMHRSGAGFAEVLKKAQELGYAEKDPGDDINGADIRRKIVISSNIAYGCVIQESDVAVAGIETITDADIAAFKRMGRICKLIASSRKLSGAVAVYVEPALLEPPMHESAIPGNFNLISFTGEHIGKQSFYGQGAGRYPTAYNVLQDCVDVRNGLRGFYNNKMEPMRVDNSSVIRQYYVRTAQIDEWLRVHIDTILDCGVVTTPLSVTQMHAWLQEQKKTDPGCFVASIRE